ncbi:hypothetical protein [Arthrobacter sp. A5]|uniref:hypothetical protein n=1 Tax=Arthrobacter sp. A5 TaxID=576926 RepID=UPI003DA9B828
MMNNDYAFWQFWHFREECLREELEGRRISREHEEERRRISHERKLERHRIPREGQGDDMDQDRLQAVVEAGAFGRQKAGRPAPR